MKTALIFDAYDDYEIRIKYIKQAMIDAGYTVHIFFADFNHYSKQYNNKNREDVEYLHAQSYAKNLSYARIHSHMQFAKTCVNKAREYPEASLIYVMVPPNSMCKEFAKYHTEHPEVKLMFDLCDMWPESLPVSGTAKKLGSPVLNIWKNYRNHYIGEADCVLSECNLFANQITSYVSSENLHTVYLCQEHHGSKINNNLSQVSFLYCGSMNNIIHIDLIAAVLEKVNQRKKTVLHLIGIGERKEYFIQEIERRGIEVIDHGVVYEEDKKQEIYSQCQFGLNLMVESVFVGLTMKSLDYMSHDLPLINNIQGDTWDLVSTKQIGINVTPDKITEVVNQIVDMNEEQYLQYRNNVISTFDEIFNKNVIEKQLDKILEEL